MYQAMTVVEFRSGLAALGLSQQAFARLLRVSGRTVQGWALGKVVVPPPVVILLRLLVAGVVTVGDIELVAEGNRGAKPRV